MGAISKIAGVIILVLVSLIGYAGYIYVKTDGEPVTIHGIKLIVDPGQVQRNQIPVEVQVYYENKAGLGLTVKGGNLTVNVNGIPLIHVTIPEERIESGNGTFALETILDNTLLGEAVARHLENGEKSKIIMEGSVSIALPLIGKPISLPVNLDFTAPSNIFPYTDTGEKILVDAGPLGRVYVTNVTIDFSRAEGDTLVFPVYITIVNELKNPIIIPQVGYQAAMNETKLAEGETETRLELGPGETGVLEATVNLTQDSIEEFLYMHILNKESSTIQLDLWIKLEVPGTGVDIGKVYHITQEIKVETNIFEYK